MIKFIGIFFVCAFWTSCVTPKVMYKHEFIDNNRTAKLFLSPGSSVNLGTKTKGKDDVMKLHNAYARICNLNKKGKETKCNDSLILDNLKM